MPNKSTKTNDIRFVESILFALLLVNGIYSKESAVELTKAIDVNPSVGKYYVSRSRVKYLTEDIRGAQEDIIAAILINPLEEGCIDVLPRLFPDATLTQVLHSSLTRQMKEQLLKRNVRLAIA